MVKIELIGNLYFKNVRKKILKNEHELVWSGSVIIRNVIYIFLALILFIFSAIFAYLDIKSFSLILLCISLGLILFSLIVIRKPTEKEWNDIKEVWHYTSLQNSQLIKAPDGIVNLKTSRNPMVNISVLFRPVIYFFYKEPSKVNKKMNLPFTDASVKVIIEVKDLQRKYARIRRYDDAFIYLKNYKNPGKIILPAKSEIKKPL
ncbi:hypothetical protein [Mesobacillus foraminis]|uniref:hypothetical protein n=1 Tax=Mesobacillus foraminis TaxID=279826 RepID=UPI0013CEC56B|nr:hypothetical protein [Mesobacillus foraminis]